MPSTTSRLEYLPPLGACLEEDNLVFSWNDAYLALHDFQSQHSKDPTRIEDENDQSSPSAQLQRFFDRNGVRSILRGPLTPFPAPNPESKKQFDTATAPINVTPSDASTTVLADCAWLSETLQIDELSALRISTIGWQRSLESQLSAGLTEEEAVGITDTWKGGAGLDTSTAQLNSSIVDRAATNNQAAYSSEESRRKRLLRIYQSEKNAILKIAVLLLQRVVVRDSNEPAWLSTVSNDIAAAQGFGVGTNKPLSPFFNEGLKLFQDLIEALQGGCPWALAEEDEALQQSWVSHLIVQQIHILELLLLHITYGSRISGSTHAHRWFTLMSSLEFCVNLELPVSQPTISLLQLLISTISLSILRPANSSQTLKGIAQNAVDHQPQSEAETELFLNEDCVYTINGALQAASFLGPSPATPAAFAWAWMSNDIQNLKKQLDDFLEEDIQLLEDRNQGRTRPSAASRNIFEEPLDAITRDFSEDDDPIGRLVHQCLTECGLFGLIPALMQIADSAYALNCDQVLWASVHTANLQLLSFSSSYVQYSPDVLLALLSVLGDDGATTTFESQHTSEVADMPRHFLADESLRSQLDQALLRFPLETAPALRLSRVLLRTRSVADQGPEILARLSHLKHYTQQVPPGFEDWDFREDENSVAKGVLKADLPLFLPANDRSLSWKMQRVSTHTEDEMRLRAGTEGYLSNPGEVPFIFIWEYEYAATDYLFALLSTASVESGLVEVATQTPAALGDACEIIALFTTQLHQLIASDDIEAANQLLSPSHSASGLDQDLPSLVFSLFEEQMQNNLVQSETTLVIDFLSNCVCFLTELVKIHPARVWSFLGRSRFLELQGNSNNLATIVLNIETLLGRYQLLGTAITLLDSLVDEITSNISEPETAPTKALTRFGSVRSATTNIPVKSKGALLTTMVKVLAAVLESIYNWNFTDAAEQVQVNRALVATLKKVLVSCYGYDDISSGKGAIADALLPAAKHVVEHFLSTSDNEIPILPLLNNLALGLQTIASTIYMKDLDLNVAQTTATLELATILVRTSLMLGRQTSKLEKLLFKATPLLIRLYARLEAYRSPVLRLLAALVEGAGSSPADPPSLLGTLGTQTAKSFVKLLSDRTRMPLAKDVELDHWNFYTAVVQNKQQWLSIVLLTGKTPRESLKSTDAEARTPSLLETAMERLRNAKTLHELQVIAILRFVSATQSQAPWALQHFADGYKELKQTLIKIMSDVQWSDKRDALYPLSLQLRIASLITEILAIDMYGARRRGERIDNRALFPELHLLRQHGVEPPLYNRSLHQSLQKNIEKKFPGVKLSQFRRTAVIQTDLGADYYYDLSAAGRILGKDKSWKAGEKSGYHAEFAAANNNLSVVEAQTELLNSWQLLALELSISALGDDHWAEALIKVARDCLRANTEANPTETLLRELMAVRVDFAFALLQRLVDVKCKHPETLTLLSAAWDAICAVITDFDDVFTGDNADYYRSLLRVLFLSLQFHLDSSITLTQSTNTKIGELGLAVSTAPTLFQILDRVVSRGFRSLSNQLHSPDTTVFPSDFVLLTAILQKLLLVPSIRTIEADVALAIAHHGTARYASTLFSWSDRLATAPSHDPLYGELSILFLLELSTIPLAAEHLAVEGILSQLNNAPIMEYLRRPKGMGPFDHPPRIHSIWTRGILPLCLNLLHAVGPPIAAEVSVFLNQFSGQLDRASASLSGRLAPSVSQPNVGRITLGMASEVHSLALIGLLIERFRVEGAQEGIQKGSIPALEWDRVQVREDVEGWVAGGGRRVRERVVPGTEREREMLGVGLEGEGSRLEVRIVSELKGAAEVLRMGV